MIRRVFTNHGLQIGFLLLLIVCVVQTTWWILDNAYYTETVRDRLLASYDKDLVEAHRLLDAGRPPDEVQALFPLLRIEEDPPGAAVRPDVIASLDEEIWRRRNRYGWEGTFFLLVLTSGMVVLYRTLRQRVQLRQRQENFIAAVGHELKSPLASLRLSGESLGLRTPTDASRERLSHRILEDVDRLERMVTNILQARRIEEGRLESHPERLDLTVLVRRVVQEMRPVLEDHGIELAVSVPEGLAVRADAMSVESVLRNLIDNAGKAVGTREAPRIGVAASGAGRWVRLRVEDNGVGFRPGDASRLFQKFYRLGDENTRTTRGSGLGLYLVRRLVELDGGRVRASSEGPGTGAAFVVHWRAAEEAA